MQKEHLLGKGITAEVYNYNKDKVLKLFYNSINKDFIKFEVEISKAIYKLGIPSPKVYDLLEKDDRQGIIFQYIEGKTMLKIMENKIWEMIPLIKKMVKLQFNIHKYTMNELPSVEEKFMKAIQNQANILGDREKIILDYFEKMPKEYKLCHGDFHPDNIIVRGNEMIAIDWTNAYIGNPLSDIARTCILCTTPFMPYGTPRIIILFAKIFKRVFYQIYIKEVTKSGKVRLKDINDWILPMAAARLNEKIPGEEKWLIKIIDTRLKLLI